MKHWFARAFAVMAAPTCSSAQAYYYDAATDYAATISSGAATITANCAHVSGQRIAIEFHLSRGSVRFVGGPKFAISEFSRTADDIITLRASGPAHELHAVIAATASIRFRNIPGAFDEIVCEEITRIPAPSR